MTKLEAHWRKVSGCFRTKLDAGASLGTEERAQLGWLLAELWPGVGMVEAGEWGEAEVKAFKVRFAAQHETWSAKEAHGEVFTLEEFKEQARALGACQVLAEREAEALSDVQFDKLKRRLVNARLSKELSKESPAFKFASQKLRLEFLAWPIRQRHEEARTQGFWHVFGQREMQRFARAQRDLEAKARSEMKKWTECQADDCSFASLYSAKAEGEDKEQESRELLRAATIYEYARESRKLRGLLWVSAWRETERQQDTHSTFDGLEEQTADKALGGWFWFLQVFAEELAANLPFTRLWRDQGERVAKALWWFPKSKTGTTRLLRVTTLPQGYSFPVPPVWLALEAERHIATTWEAVELPRGPKSDGLPERARSFAQDGVEVLVVKVNWENFDNRALGESFARLAERIRPQKSPGPKAQGHNQHHEFLTPLKDLAAMRRVSWEKSSDKELYRAAKRARERFKEWFSFGEEPENGPTFKQRAKIGGTPSPSKVTRFSRR